MKIFNLSVIILAAALSSCGGGSSSSNGAGGVNSSMRPPDNIWGVQFQVEPNKKLINFDDLAYENNCDGFVNWGSVAAIDINNDNLKDLIYTTRCGDKKYDEIYGVGHQSYLIVALQKADGSFEFGNNKIFGKNSIPLGNIGGHMKADFMIPADINNDGYLDFTIIQDRDNWNRDEEIDYYNKFGKEINTTLSWAAQQFVALSNKDGTYNLIPIASPSTAVFGQTLFFIKSSSDDWLIWGASENWATDQLGGPAVYKVGESNQLIDVTNDYYEASTYQFTSCTDWCIGISARDPKNQVKAIADISSGLQTLDFKNRLSVVHNPININNKIKHPILALTTSSDNGFTISSTSNPYDFMPATELTWGEGRNIRKIMGEDFFDLVPQMPKPLKLYPNQPPIYISFVESYMFDSELDINTIDKNSLDVNCKFGAKSYWYLVTSDKNKRDCEDGLSIFDRWTFSRMSNFPYAVKIEGSQIKSLPAIENPFINESQDLAFSSHKFETERIYYFDTNGDGYDDASSFNINSMLWFGSKNMLSQASPITLFINNKNGKLIHHSPANGVLPFEKGKAQYYTDLNNDGIIDIIQYIENPAGQPQTIEIFYGKKLR
jgi:hypothetical protein